MGEAKRSTPSRKNGRFSGKKSANWLLVGICPTSDSTCEKSGVMAASRPLLAAARRGSAGRGAAPAGGVGRGHVVAARGQSGEPGELARAADPAVAAARDRAAVVGVALVARVVAPDQDAPVHVL